MNLKDFEKFIEDKIVSRGFEYFKHDDVRKVEKVSENEFSAAVAGSNLYTVYVKLNGETIVEYECDCPYDYGNTCKHAVAVFYKLRAKDFTDSAEKLKAISDNLHTDALRKFVTNLLKKDRKFRNEFFREFDEDFEEDEFEDEFDEDYY
jgi:uncharacterized Zn finger protein